MQILGPLPPAAYCLWLSGFLSGFRDEGSNPILSWEECRRHGPYWYLYSWIIAVTLKVESRGKVERKVPSESLMSIPETQKPLSSGLGSETSRGFMRGADYQDK